MNLDEEVCKEVVRRAYRLDFDTVYKMIGDKPFILAGGSLCGDAVHDYDLYPVQGREYDIAQLSVHLQLGKCPVKGVEWLAKTRNALTVRLPNKQVVQFCRYSKPTLKELVDSFDFSHIQVGVEFKGEGDPPHADAVYYTKAFLLAGVTRRTEYTGSEYPLGSAIRVMKYWQRGRLTKAAATRAVVKALADVLERGYRDYNDFKDQMDAIDLGLPDCAEMRLLYDAAHKRGLVRDPDKASDHSQGGGDE